MTTETILVEVRGVSFEVNGNLIPAERGARERGTGIQLEPDYPATFEAEEIFVAGTDADLSRMLDDRIIEEIESACHEMAQRMIDDYEADAAEQRYEYRRDQMMEDRRADFVETEHERRNK